MRDDDIIDASIGQFMPLNFKSGSSGLLSVNWKAWMEKLVVVERRSRIGCFVLLVVVLFARSIFQAVTVLILPFSLIGMIYVIVHAYRHKNLKDHGRYRYEIFPNKVVRFSDRDFRAFEYSELSKVTVKPYGVLLQRKLRWRNIWLSWQNQEIMVLPASMTSYPAVEEYVVEQFKQEKKA